MQESPQFKKDILVIKSIGLKRVKVEFQSYTLANSLIEHEIIKKNNLIAFIPKFYTQKKGIIRAVDTFFDEKFIISEIDSSIPVVEVKRIKRRVVNSGTKEISYVNRQMVIITFLGNRIPDTVKLNLCNFIVEPYISPVVQCFNCLRYGHTAAQCKGKCRCKNCTKEHEPNVNCIEPKMCIHCNSLEHISVSKDCPIYTKQRNIKKTMAFHDASFKEAEFLVDNPSYAKVATNNRFDILKNTDNFPELPSHNSNSTFLLSKPKSIQNQQQSNHKQIKRKHISPPETPKPSDYSKIIPSTSQLSLKIQSQPPYPLVKKPPNPVPYPPPARKV